MRPMIRFIQKKFGQRKLVAAEIGVQKGDNARNMTNSLQFKQLFLIDIWDSQISSPGRYRNLNKKRNTLFCNFKGVKINEAFDIFYPAVIKMFEKNTNIIILRKTSVEACKEFSNKTFDFVYIDANHSYDMVKTDIESWFPKVKIGGVIGGHDFGRSPTPYPGLEKAVHEFSRKIKYKLHQKIADWWIEL